MEQEEVTELYQEPDAGMEKRVGAGYNPIGLINVLNIPDSNVSAQSLINALLEPIESVNEALRKNYAVRRILMQEAMEQLGASEDRINLMLAERLEARL